jgi:hypothetical protein
VRLSQNNRQVTIQRLKNVKVIVSMVAIIVFGVATFIYTGVPTSEAYASSASYPKLSFHDPVLISGTDGQVNAVYRFSEVTTGVDVDIEILDLYNGASLSNMDHFTAGYYDAWQPFVFSPAGLQSWIEWRITFKKAGTSLDTVLTQLCATAVDVDGDGVSLQELVSADKVKSYSRTVSANLNITFNSDSCYAVSTVANVANIDTVKWEAMFMMIFKNTSSIVYRTGAMSSSAVDQVRQNSIYFKYFDAMPTPLPIELIKFSGKEIYDNKSLIQWSSGSETNNDFYTLERSADGIKFKEIYRVKGAGNSNTIRNYSFVDNAPEEQTSYYRLKQTDYDGTTVTFKTIQVTMKGKSKEAAAIRVSPNPFQDSFTAEFDLQNEEEVHIQLIGINGAILSDEVIHADKGTNVYNYQSPVNGKTGIYNIRVINKERVIASSKLLKN